MKFEEEHRKEILACLSQNGFIKTQFSFRKKKGRIFIHIDDRMEWFSFFKKSSFFIDPDSLKRVDIGFFEIQTTATAMLKLNLWADVIREFNKWLKAI